MWTMLVQSTNQAAISPAFAVPAQFVPRQTDRRPNSGLNQAKLMAICLTIKTGLIMFLVYNPEIGACLSARPCSGACIIDV